MDEDKTIKIPIGDGEIELTEEQIASMFLDKVKKSQEPEEKEPSKQPEIADKNRKLKYINSYGKEVWLAEEQAIAFHNPLIKKGGKFMGDQNGNMTLPRDNSRRGFYNKFGERVPNPMKSVR